MTTEQVPRASDAAAAAVAANLLRDPALASWIQPAYRTVSALLSLRESALARPHMRYLILDRFFDEDQLATLIDHHGRLDFEDCDPGANYDSMIATSGWDFASDFFGNPAWHNYVAFLLGVTLKEPDRSTLLLRRHPGDAKGFWPHSDVNKGQVAFVIGYFNRGWSRRDGALLQFWTRLNVPVAQTDASPLLRWDEFKGRRLDFLDERRHLFIEAVMQERLLPCDLILTDQVLPEYNRVVLAALSDDHAHSVTPSGGRVRDGFLQWLF